MPGICLNSETVKENTSNYISFIATWHVNKISLFSIWDLNIYKKSFYFYTFVSLELPMCMDAGFNEK